MFIHDQNLNEYVDVRIPCNLFFPEPLKYNHEKTFPEYHSLLSEVFSIEMSIPTDSVKVCTMHHPCVHYFYLLTQYKVFIRL